MPSTTTPNMSLVLPSVGTQPGPDYANNVNNSLSTIDQHDHTSGNGVQVPSAGLNINADLPISNNNLTLLRSLRFNPQLSPLALGTDLGCLYESGVDLYYNDGDGNQIRITANGSVAGATGSITGLVSPASASYSPGTATFTWQSDSNVAANMDMRSAILRNSSVSSNKITLSAPGSLPANYSLTLPSALPPAQQFVTFDSSGNVAANWAVDNSTIEVSSNTVQVKDLGIVNAKIADATITGSKLVSDIHLDGDPTLQGNSFFIVGQTAGSPLNILRGTVDSSGNVVDGAGFTGSSGGSPTRISIAFSTPFSATPSVTVSPVISNSFQTGFSGVYNVTASGFDAVTVRGNAPSPSSTQLTGFNFIAIGPR